MSACWVIADPRDGRPPWVASQFAQLFGLPCSFWSRAESPHLGGATSGRPLILLNYLALASLNRDQAAMLRRMLHAGSMVYIRGGFDRRDQCSLFPLADVTFSVVPPRKASEHRIEAEWPIPEVLQGEVNRAELMLPCARGLQSPTRPLVNAHFEGGERAPFLFAVRQGCGAIICDLLPDVPATCADLPIFDRLANPLTRHAELGALIAVRIAAGLGPDVRPSLNLTMDDRPTNFDFFNARKLRRWLAHVESRFPGVHVDFAWTPDQLYTGRSYVDTLKEFNTGVVWHGFKHHVNHRQAADLASDLRDGREMVARISREFEVKFQQVMVFPFEAFGVDVFPLLEAGGFLATFANRLAPVGLWSTFPSFMDYSTPLHEQFCGVFPVLRRSTCESLTRDVLLSHAALNLPILMVMHPQEVGLRRWPYRLGAIGTPEHCDHVLSFAAAKRLGSQSLEEIAVDQVARPEPLPAQLMESCPFNAPQLH